jgi:hypothetical protein
MSGQGSSSTTLKELDLSNNRFGATGANVVANLCKEFYCDRITIGTGEAKSAPTLVREDEENYDSNHHHNKTVAYNSEYDFYGRYVEQEEGDDSSFVDNDSFDGEEDDEGEDNLLMGEFEDETLSYQNKSGDNTIVSGYQRQMRRASRSMMKKGLFMKAPEDRVASSPAKRNKKLGSKSRSASISGRIQLL